MEADKLGGYTKGMASDDRRQGGGRYIRRSLSSSSQIYSKEKMLKTRGP
jgi:hypothetical protein